MKPLPTPSPPHTPQRCAKWSRKVRLFTHKVNKLQEKYCHKFFSERILFRSYDIHTETCSVCFYSECATRKCPGLMTAFKNVHNCAKLSL